MVSVAVGLPVDSLQSMGMVVEGHTWRIAMFFKSLAALILLYVGSSGNCPN